MIKKNAEQGRPVSCLINNPFIPWVTDVAISLGLPSAMLWVQSCACFASYYHFYHGTVPFPDEEHPEIDVRLPSRMIYEMGTSNRRNAHIGDVIIVVIKEAVPNSPPERSEVIRAVIVCTSKELKRDNGACGFRGTRRGTPFAAQTAVGNTIQIVADQGMQRVEVMIKGPGLGRDATLRAIRRSGGGA
ncbi:hypothetical protein D5086_033222 [Populus alba]|uniref:Uncharacterized protein n=1 Tax=Populus alba TaxID=43335 RepID=A0ACC4AG82_POPAL